jgi:phosphoribosylformylglycinamidine synthase
MKVAVIVFPGSNCDHDAEYAFKDVLGLETEMIWHKDTDLNNADFVFIPGGFSFGDYLRCGSVARFSPIMTEVVKHANAGKPVMGVCNGFQVLTECGLLEGALVRNTSLKFICKTAPLRIENVHTLFTSKLTKNDVLHIPIAHGEGRFTADADTLKSLNDNDQVIFRYSTDSGELTDESNPNGSREHIAGITNKAGNVLGMMPHPERAVATELGSVDGLKILSSIAESLALV